MLKITRWWKKILDLFSHPAWNFGSCFFAALSAGVAIFSLIGWIAFDRRMQGFLSWIKTPIQFPLYVVIVVFIVGLSFLLAEGYRFRKENNLRKGKTSEESAFNIHGVLWKCENEWGMGTYYTGPYCPEHYLELRVIYDEMTRKYIFVCNGLTKDGKHIYPGPTYDELIKPDGREDLYADDKTKVSYDAHKRIEAILRKEGKI